MNMFTDLPRQSPPLARWRVAFVVGLVLICGIGVYFFMVGI